METSRRWLAPCQGLEFRKEQWLTCTEVMQGMQGRGPCALSPNSASWTGWGPTPGEDSAC